MVLCPPAHPPPLSPAHCRLPFRLHANTMICQLSISSILCPPASILGEVARLPSLSAHTPPTLQSFNRELMLPLIGVTHTSTPALSLPYPCTPISSAPSLPAAAPGFLHTPTSSARAILTCS
ncbi:hypothetical protein PVAP13_4NG185208 [Panicum virgatum]|uniref:Uncharacterized protein n=1 Tax=Panicum virgatum TaxID=38727 RepID=A0A8T0T2N2_PANVG|nr:hypothetical protein PVAP13_4NG185208 [Panicum virgatum]